MSVRMIDIADKVGVSRATVSNVLNAKHARRYSATTRDRILKTAKEYGYRPGVLARAIKEPLQQIAFIGSGVAHFDVSFMREVLNGIQKAANEENYTLITSELNVSVGRKDNGTFERESRERTEKLVNMITSKLLDGLLIDKSRFGIPQIEFIKKTGVPCVFINGLIPFENQPYYSLYKTMYWISIDHQLGGSIAVEHLMDYGHRRIAMLSPETNQYSPDNIPKLLEDTRIAYINVLEKSGIEHDPNLIVEASFNDKTTVLKSLRKLLELPEPPTAIFAAEDTMAVLAMNYLRERGLKVPNDISVIGYGNLPGCYMAVPNLTTIDVPWNEMGQQGLKVLASLIEGKEVKHIQVLEPKLLERASVGPPKK